MSNKVSKQSPNVSALYDQLLATEQSMRPNTIYPIHKKLRVSELGCNDIYDWILSQIGLPQTGAILDAGCGVGWGTGVLAKHTHAQLIGISVSESEIKLARENAIHKNVSFSHQSFDSIGFAKYDFILAVESVKHSQDIAKTIRILSDGLKEDGKLVIVDDFFNETSENQAHPQFLSDWQLSELLSVKLLPANANNVSCETYDLTASMTPQYTLLAKCKHALVALLLVFKPQHLGWQAFRGGYRLEKLYKQKKMRYQVIVLTKSSQK
jgi:2-polyprenyl-3-methyl-5-hydroxy-6-metoxy-1,4-benzoquinol methylase